MRNENKPNNLAHLKEKVPCRRCTGTGFVPKGLDIIDDMIASLKDVDASEIEDIIDDVIKMHGIKKSKKGIFKVVMWALVFKIKHKGI